MSIGKNNSDAKKASEDKKNSVIGGLVIAFILVVSIIGCSGEQDSQPKEITDSQVFIIATNYVQGSLKSPASADFPTYEYVVTKIGDNKWAVKSYVDAQNGFGANIRTNWIVRLSYNGGDWADKNNWTLENLSLEE